MSDQQNPQKPGTDDQIWFISKFLVIQIFGILGLLAAVGVAVMLGGVLGLTGLLGKVTMIPAGILVYCALNRERQFLMAKAYLKFLLDDAVKFGFETEESARKLAGLPPKKNDSTLPPST